jgi:hypothetical protein
MALCWKRLKHVMKITTYAHMVLEYCLVVP